jgi:putative membrane protein
MTQRQTIELFRSGRDTKRIRIERPSDVMWWHGWGSGPGGWWLIAPIVWTVLLWAAVAAGAVYLLRRPPEQRPPQRRPGDAAAALLAEGYARGEVSDEEYRGRLAVLREH